METNRALSARPRSRLRIWLTVSISSAVSGSSGCRIPTVMCSAVFIVRSFPGSRSHGHSLTADGIVPPTAASGCGRTADALHAPSLARLAVHPGLTAGKLVRQEDEFILYTA